MEVIIPVIGETIFSQHIDVLMDKLQLALDTDPSILMVIMAVVTESKCYPSLVINLQSRMAFMHDGLIRSATDFITVSNVLLTLDTPVIVEGHMWCLVKSVSFKVWVRRDEAIDFETCDPAFMAEGVSQYCFNIHI